VNESVSMSTDQNLTAANAVAQQLANPIGLIPLVVGLGAGFYLLWFMRRRWSAQHWPTTQAEILQSDLEEDADGFAPRVEYSYEVNGIRYLGERLDFHTVNRTTDTEARKHLEPYPVRSIIPLYYNPQNPSDSVLNCRMSLWQPIFWICFRIFMILVGLDLLR